jgi:hypothetical protein
MARAGFGIVAVGRDGDVVAYAYGVPPSWLRTAAAAELWAYYTVLRQLPEPQTTTTDGLGVLEALTSGPAAACAAGSKLARVWRMVFQILDEAGAKAAASRLTWMPSHGAVATIGRAVKSNGRVVTATDWRANRLADALAKAAASQDRAPRRCRDLLGMAAVMVEHEAALIGITSYEANNCKVSFWHEDGSLGTATKRDAEPPQVRRGAWGRRRPASTVPEQAPPLQLPAPAPDLGSLDDGAAERCAWRRAAPARAKKAAALLEAQRAHSFRTAWLQDRALAPLRPATGPTAEERLDAMRRRLAERSRL